MDAKAVAKQLAAHGHGQDKILAHINPQEAALLAKMFGGTTNPHTGLPQFGWLQDWGSDFSMKHLNPFIEFRDPHKSFQQHLTKGMQSTVGPIALDFVPVVGGALSAGERAWLTHESKNPASSNYKAPSNSAGAEVAQGVATQAAVNGITGSSSGSSSAGMGMLGGLGSLFGGGSSSSSGGSAQTAALQQQVQQLKQEIQQHYDQQGAGSSDQVAQDHAQVDAWAQQQLAALQQQQNGAQRTIQQEAAQ